MEHFQRIVSATEKNIRIIIEKNDEDCFILIIIPSGSIKSDYLSIQSGFLDFKISFKSKNQNTDIIRIPIFIDYKTDIVVRNYENLLDFKYNIDNTNLKACIFVHRSAYSCSWWKPKKEKHKKVKKNTRKRKKILVDPNNRNYDGDLYYDKIHIVSGGKVNPK